MNSYIPKFTWVHTAKGEYLKGLKNEGIVIAIGGQELYGELAAIIEKLENETKKIPQMAEANTKAVDNSTQSVKIEITEEKPKLKAKNVKSK